MTSSILPGGDVPFVTSSSDRRHSFSANNVVDDDDDDDDAVLAALGYKAEFKREFSLFTTFCVSFAVLGLLPSFASTLFYGMGYAGTAGEFLILLSGSSRRRDGKEIWEKRWQGDLGKEMAGQNGDW